MADARADILIVGGGIVGLATAYALQRGLPHAKVTVLEKEPRLAVHQTGHNSGVIHSGIYYRAGTLKARLCTTGNASMQAFCAEHDVPVRRCGKLIIATAEAELQPLEALQRRGVENGLDVQRLGPAEIRDCEPHAAGIAALHVPSTAVVDYRRVAAKLAELVVAGGGSIRCRVEVSRIGVGRVETSEGRIHTGLVVNCAGLYSDRLARGAGAVLDTRIVPFRGEYFELRRERRDLVRGLIYPVPNPLFPFLGVHCTRMIDGSVHLGPNAILAFAREGYRKSRINMRDLVETLAFPGWWRLAGRHWRAGLQELGRSLSRTAFVRSLQRLVPAITEDCVVPTGAGVRAQALRSDGTLEDDFLIVRSRGAIHVCNAPSPAATASLEIGKTIASMVAAFPAGSPPSHSVAT